MKQIFACAPRIRSKWILPICLLFIAQLVLSQEAEDHRFTMKQNHTLLENVLNSIQEQTGYKVFYNASLVKEVYVSVDAQNERLNTVLENILRGTSLSYTIEKDTIIIFKAQSSQTPVKEKEKNIFGVVKDENQEPLPGATIRISGSTGGSITDASGNFMMIIPEEAKTLIVSFIGKETKKIPIENNSVFTIILREDELMLSDLVVTGYQTIDRRDMVGAYTSLKANEVLLPNYTSIDQMLQGQVAGLMITNSSTRAGATPTITLRGTSTLQGTTSPLWVVDGIIQEDIASIKSSNPMLSSKDGNDIAQLAGSAISWLNPNDIETIVVLKDASATAIYGSRASNGVIVITTKKGTSDKLSVNYSTNMTISVRPTYDDYYVMNSKERINFSKEAYDAGAYYQRVPLPQMYTYEGMMQLYLSGNISEEQFIKQYHHLETVNTDWLDLVTRTAVSHQHNVSLSGKSKSVSYNTSFNYSKMEGIEKGNDQERFSGRIRVGLEASSRLKFDITLSGTINKGNGFTANVNPQNYAISTSRAIPAYEEGGSYAYYQKDASYNYNKYPERYGLKYNILNEMENSYTKIYTPQMNATLNAQWDILRNGELKYEFVAGYTDYSRSSDSYADENTYYIATRYRGYDYADKKDISNDFYLAAQLPHGGVLSKTHASSRNYNMQNKLFYSKTINSLHRFNAMAAWEIRSNATKMNEYAIYGFIGGKGNQIARPPAPSEIKPTGDANLQSVEGWSLMEQMYSDYSIEERRDNYLSAFASLAYSYDNKYILNCNIRNDASNRFGQDINRRFDPTYSFGFSWRVSEENFSAVLKPHISALTLKTTYGIQGNVLTNYGPEMILLWPELSDVYKEYTSDIKRLPNPLLNWERTKSWNWGANFGLFDNKLTIDLDGYLRDSKPLSTYPLPPEYGDTQIMQNGAKIRNSGIEVTASFNPIAKRDIRLGMSVNFSKNWNTVRTISEDDTQSITTSSYLNGNAAGKGIVLEKGYDVNGFWVYEFDKLDSQTGYPLFNKMDMANYESIADFLHYAGSKMPLVSTGLNINFGYKSFTLNTGLTATLGGKTLLPNPYLSFVNGMLPNPEVNLNKELTDRWKQPGDEYFTTIPGVYTGGAPVSIKDPSGKLTDQYVMWASSSDRLISKSFLRCRQIALSWYAPQSITRPLGINSLSLSTTGTNIFVIADNKYKGMDPETGSSVLPRSISLGLNVSF